MKVRQLTGRYAGEIVDMPPHIAKACIQAGSAAPIQEIQPIKKRFLEEQPTKRMLPERPTRESRPVLKLKKRG